MLLDGLLFKLGSSKSGTYFSDVSDVSTLCYYYSSEGG